MQRGSRLSRHTKITQEIQPIVILLPIIIIVIIVVVVVLVIVVIVGTSCNFRRCCRRTLGASDSCSCFAGKSTKKPTTVLRQDNKQTGRDARIIRPTLPLDQFVGHSL